LFGSKGQSADHVLERRVSIARGRSDAGRVTVASGDRLQRDLVMGMGGAVIGAEALRRPPPETD
jgi:predicted RNA-binding protein with PIN domain